MYEYLMKTVEREEERMKGPAMSYTSLGGDKLLARTRSKPREGTGNGIVNRAPCRCRVLRELPNGIRGHMIIHRDEEVVNKRGQERQWIGAPGRPEARAGPIRGRCLPVPSIQNIPSKQNSGMPSTPPPHHPSKSTQAGPVHLKRCNLQTSAPARTKRPSNHIVIPDGHQA